MQNFKKSFIVDGEMAERDERPSLPKPLEGVGYWIGGKFEQYALGMTKAGQEQYTREIIAPRFVTEFSLEDPDTGWGLTSGESQAFQLFFAADIVMRSTESILEQLKENEKERLEEQQTHPNDRIERFVDEVVNKAQDGYAANIPRTNQEIATKFRQEAGKVLSQQEPLRRDETKIPWTQDELVNAAEILADLYSDVVGEESFVGGVYGIMGALRGDGTQSVSNMRRSAQKMWEFIRSRGNADKMPRIELSREDRAAIAVQVFQRIEEDRGRFELAILQIRNKHFLGE